MSTVEAIFGVPLLLAATMISPSDLSLRGLITTFIVVAVALPFVGWRTFLIEAIFPPAERSESLVQLWAGGSVLVVAVLFFLSSAFDYPPAGVRIVADAHLLIPFMPRTGLAVGLFTLCQLVACGLVGAISPVLRPEIAIESAVEGGTVLFLVLYRRRLAPGLVSCGPKATCVPTP
jgi:hypothetical protein